MGLVLGTRLPFERLGRAPTYVFRPASDPHSRWSCCSSSSPTSTKAKFPLDERRHQCRIQLRFGDARVRFRPRASSERGVHPSCVRGNLRKLFPPRAPERLSHHHTTPVCDLDPENLSGGNLLVGFFSDLALLLRLSFGPPARRPKTAFLNPTHPVTCIPPFPSSSASSRLSALVVQARQARERVLGATWPASCVAHFSIPVCVPIVPRDFR